MEFVIFCIITGVTLVISFLCSLSEAALYSISFAYVRHQAESGSKIGKILLSFKEDISRPVAVILILNTLANTGGPAIAGAIAVRLWGDAAVGIYAVGMTFAILLVCEITPKILGANFCKSVAGVMAIPLAILSKILSPVLFVVRGLTRTFRPRQGTPRVSQDEVLSMAAIGAEEGALDHLEGSVISNVIGLDQILVRDVLTPRVVVFRLQNDTRIADLSREICEWSFTRIPLYSSDDPDHLTHYVMQIDIYRELLKGETDKTLQDIARPLSTIPELMSADKLLQQMFERKEQICAVVDEYGGLAGIITLEDLIEEVVGLEIVDEYDTIGDQRTFAGFLHAARTRRRTV